MKKFMSYTIVGCMLASCSFIKLDKLVSNQNIALTDNRVHFDLISGRILLRDSVNFILDIGAPNVIFQNKIGSFPISDSLTLGKLENANGKMIENKCYVITKMNNRLFNAERPVFRVIEKEANCYESDGFVGCELLQEQIFSINFQEQFVERVTEQRLSAVKSNYLQATVTDYDGYYFLIEIKVDGKIIEAKLDTGNPHDLLLKKSDFDLLPKKPELSFFKSKTTIDTLFRQKSIATIGEASENPIVVQSNHHLKRNLLGTGFMKNYNWIIDYKNGAIYYQMFMPNEPLLVKDRVIISKGDLLYYQTDDADNIQNLGKTIASLEGNQITAANICFYSQMINGGKSLKELEAKFEDTVPKLK
ncbi:MAG TPA: hypothetical protein VF581_02850 [Flavobacterium sp.]|jgi:hypothetical protein